MSEIRQFELIDYNDNSRLVCWLPNDKRLKVGSRITLKEIPKRDWIVNRVYRTVKDYAELNRRWRVGGLL
jgi:hypothetical protein